MAPSSAVEVGFEERVIKVDESCGSCKLKVVRTGVLDKAFSVMFDTSDGEAKAGDDYVSSKG